VFLLCRGLPFTPSDSAREEGNGSARRNARRNAELREVGIGNGGEKLPAGELRGMNQTTGGN